MNESNSFLKAFWILLAIPITAIAIFTIYHIIDIPLLSDVWRYQEIGQHVQDVRYSDSAVIKSEYPPISTSFFYVLSLATPNDMDTAWVVFIIAFLMSCVGYLYLINESGKIYPFLFAVFVITIALGPSNILYRHDIVVGAAIFFSFITIKKKPASSSAWLVLATSIKILPIILIPYLLLRAQKRWHFIQGLFTSIVLLIAVTMAILGPSATLSNVTFMLNHHEDRAFTADSSWSGFHLIYKDIQDQKSSTSFHHYGIHNDSLVPYLGRSKWILVIGVLLIYLWYFEKRHNITGFIFLVTLFSWVVISSPLSTPQYLIWMFLPFLTWYFYNRLRRKVTILEKNLALIIIVTCFIAHLNLLLYEDLYQQSRAIIAVLNLRTALLSLLIILPMLYFQGSSNPNTTH